MIDIVNCDVQQEKDDPDRNLLVLPAKYNLKGIARSILRLGGNIDEWPFLQHGSRLKSG